MMDPATVAQLALLAFFVIMGVVAVRAYLVSRAADQARALCFRCRRPIAPGGKSIVFCNDCFPHLVAK